MTNEEKKVERERARGRKKKKTDATPQVAPLEGTAWRPISRRYDCACEDPVRCLCVLMGKWKSRNIHIESSHILGVVLAQTNDRSESFPTPVLHRPCTGEGARPMGTGAGGVYERPPTWGSAGYVLAQVGDYLPVRPSNLYWYGNHGRPGPRPNGTYCVIGTTYRFSPFRRSLGSPVISLVVVGLGERDVLSGSPRLGRSRPPDPRLNTPRDRIFGRLPK